jgi:integrase
MKLSMNLRKHPRHGTWYVWIGRSEKHPRGRLVSLKTTDEDDARRIFAEVKRKHLEDKLIRLTGDSRVTISQLAEAFTTDADRVSLSEKTLRQDKLSLKLLMDAIGDKPIRTIREQDFKQFKTVLMARNLSPFSINSYRRHILSALNWAVDQDWIKRTPRFKPVKTPEPLPRVLSIDEIDRLLKYAEANDRDTHRVIRFCLWSGCRRIEIAGLRYEDIKDGYFHIRGKGDKERSVPLLPGALEAIGGLFDIGLVFPRWHLDTYTHRFQDVAKGAGVSATLHDIRHTAATFMLTSGVSLPVVQKILGHRDIKTTQIYAKVVDELMRSEMGKLSYGGEGKAKVAPNHLK